MPELERFSITVEPELLGRFDAWLARSSQSNRSEAIRDLLRARLAEEDLAAPGATCVATLTLVYDHTRRDLGERLTDLGHEHSGAVIATMHVHLDHDLCLEVTALRGRADALRRYAAQVSGLRGVLHGKLVLAAPGAEDPSAG